MAAVPFHTFVTTSPVATVVGASDKLPIVQGGVSKQTSVALIVENVRERFYPVVALNDQNTDIVSQTLFSVTDDGWYDMSSAIITKVSDAAASTSVRARLTYTKLDGTVVNADSTTDLTVPFDEVNNPQRSFIQAGTQILIEVTDTSGLGYGTASYDVSFSCVQR